MVAGASLSSSSQTGLIGVDWRPVIITMKMAITALRALSIDTAADVPCNQTGWLGDCAVMSAVISGVMYGFHQTTLTLCFN